MKTVIALILVCLFAVAVNGNAQFGAVLTSSDIEVSGDETSIIAFKADKFKSIRITVKNTGNTALRDVAIYAAPNSTAAASDISDDVDGSDEISDTLAAGAHDSWSCSDCSYGHITVVCDATTDSGCQAYIIGN